MEDETYENENAAPEEYQEPQPEQISDGSPNPVDFDDYDNYVKAVVDWKVKQVSPGSLPPGDPKTVVGHAVAEGVAYALQRDRQEMAQAQARAQQDIGPIPDDPHGAERSELERLSKEYGKKALMAEASGKSELAKRWRENQMQMERSLEKLPPRPEITYAQEQAEAIDDVSVKQLFDPKLKNAPMWDHPRMLADAPIVVARANKAAKTVLRLPMEESAWGNISEVKPSNMVTVELSPEQMKDFKRQVYGVGDADPDTIFRRSWQTLHVMGYADTAKRAFKEKESGEGKSLDRMTQKEFEAEMNRRELERRGGKPKRGFVLPRPIKR